MEEKKETKTAKEIADAAWTHLKDHGHREDEMMLIRQHRRHRFFGPPNSHQWVIDIISGKWGRQYLITIKLSDEGDILSVNW